MWGVRMIRLAYLTAEKTPKARAIQIQILSLSNSFNTGFGYSSGDRDTEDYEKDGFDTPRERSLMSGIVAMALNIALGIVFDP